MAVGVDTNHMAFVDNSLDDFGIFLHVGANRKKSGFDSFSLEDVKNPWRPFVIMAVIKGERNSIKLSSALMHHSEVTGEFIVNLSGQRLCFIFTIDSNASSPVGTFVGYSDKIAFANLGYGIARLDRLEFGKVFLVQR